MNKKLKNKLLTGVSDICLAGACACAGVAVIGWGTALVSSVYGVVEAYTSPTLGSPDFKVALDISFTSLKTMVACAASSLFVLGPSAQAIFPGTEKEYKYRHRNLFKLKKNKTSEQLDFLPTIS